MTKFEELCNSLNVKKGSKFEVVVSNLINDLIFNGEREYSDDEIFKIVSEKFKKLFPYI